MPENQENQTQRPPLAARKPVFTPPRPRPSTAALMRNAPGGMSRVDGIMEQMRRQVPAPAPRSGDYVAPRTPTEELLVTIWYLVLGREQIGVTDNFFELGGQSLLATQVVSRMRESFGIDLPLRVLFEAPTVSQLAHKVDEALREGSELAAPPISRITRKGPLPLSFAQQRLWIIDQLEPDTGAYNLPFSLRLQGSLDMRALTRSWDEIIRRHEVLRTRIVTVDGAPMQEVLPAHSLGVSVIDLSDVEPGAREPLARRLAADEARRPFDLAGAPLRALIVKLGADDHVVLFTVHHIASDGWSIGILAREFTALYEAYRQGQLSSLPELPIQYADYAVWQRAWLSGDELERQVRFWRDTLAGLPPLELPTDHPRPAVLSHRGATEPFAVSVELSEALQNLSRTHNATLFMTLVAAWQVVLSRSAGQNDIAVGTDVAGRNRSETENLIGFFINQLVLRSRIDHFLSFAELLKQVRETTLAVYAAQDLPFDRLVEELAPERDSSRSPFFQAKLVLQNAPQESLILGGLGVGGFGVDAAATKLDLHLMLGYSPKRGIGGILRYVADLFEQETILRMLEDFQIVLESAVADPGRPLSSILLPSDSQRQQILLEWSRGDLAATDMDQLSEEELDRLLAELAEAG